MTRVVESDRRESLVGYEVDSESGRDVRRELARAVVTSGWGLVEMRPMRVSLEEVFIKLTTDESAEPTGAEPPETPGTPETTTGETVNA